MVTHRLLEMVMGMVMGMGMVMCMTMVLMAPVIHAAMVVIVTCSRVTVAFPCFSHLARALQS